jgi:opacity protein-like surface antigen
MKRTAQFIALVFLMIVAPRAGAQLVPDIYRAAANFLNPDPNSGLTTFRSLLIPMGGLAEGMGTAYTAVGKDSSYFEANPAASCSLEFTELAIYHNNWIADTRIEGAVYTIRYKGLGFGAGGKWLYLPFTSYDDFGGRLGAGYYSEAMTGFNLSYNFFPGYYFNGLALGATGKLAYRSVPDVGTVDPSTGLSETAGQNALAIMVDGGMLTRFNLLKFYSSRSKNFSVGFVVKNFGPPVLGDPLPTMAVLGLAYSPLRPFTFSLDVSQPVNLLEPSKSESFSVAAGGLVDIAKFFRLQGGLLLKGGNPRISVGSTFDVELVRIVVNYTLDLTTQLTPLNRISIQAAFALGDLGRADLAKKVDTLYLNGLEVYARGETAAAVSFWTEALKLDPTFDPARESLLAAQGSMDLQKTMESLQRLEP